ncbi:MAG: thiamine pyrophosphate-binding protein [SAR324 cluster bacterium]|nr:thiamine pyrophosphate-binding protein [SAR324 cluster bacterium]
MVTSVSSEPRTLSDLIIDYLEQFGVEYVFGVPGGHNSAFYEALARSERRGGIRAILSRHETGAAFMAAGYSRETGKLGVCCATTGPGATNLITGVAAAYADHDPLLVITAQTLLPRFGQAAFQESSPDIMDTSAMLGKCTRYNTIVTHPRQLEHKLTTALTRALQSPRGPAHISIPVDIFRAPAPEKCSYPNFSQLLSVPSSSVDLAALDSLYQIVSDGFTQGKRIVLFVGQGCAGASQEIMAFAERINAPVLTTQGGKTWINPYHPLACGVFGFAGHETARRVLADESVDLILAVGTSLGQWETSAWDTALLNDKLIHIHFDSTYFVRSPMARLHVQGSIKTIFQDLVTRLDTLRHSGKSPLSTTKLNTNVPSPERHGDYLPPQIEVKEPESYQASDSAVVKPQFLIRKLLQNFPPETRFLVDIGNWLAWTIHYLFPPHPENYRLSVETAAMGWGIGSAVGTAFGVPPKTPVLCLTGDGCFLMNGQEITVAVAERLPVIFVILNDRSYGMVKHRHRQTGTESLEFALPPVDFSLMAKAMGAVGYSIHRPEDLEQLDYQAIYSHQGPTVLDVYIDPEEIPPLGMF